MGYLVTLITAAGGYVLARWLLRRSHFAARRRNQLAWALAPALGFGAVSLLLFFFLYAGGGRRWVWPSFFLLTALALVASLRARRVDGAHERRRPRARPAAATLLSGLLLLLTLGFLARQHFVWVEARPYGTFDAVAIWNAHALFLYRADEGHAEIFSSLRRGHPDYPLFLPGAVAAQFELRGEEDLRIPQAMTVAFLVGLILLVDLGVRTLGRPAMALPALVLLSSTPIIPRFAFTQCADLPVAYLATAAVVCLASRWRETEGPHSGKVPAFVCGFLLSMLAWTKNEGVVLALLFVSVFALLAAAAGRASWRTPLEIGLGALPGAAAWVLFKLHWVGTSETRAFLADLSDKLSDPGRWQIVAQAFSCRLSPGCAADRWGVAWIFLAGAAVAAWWLRGAQSGGRRYLGTCCGAAFVSYFGFYLATPHNVRWHLESSLDRLLLHLFPLFVVWVFSGLVAEQAQTTTRRTLEEGAAGGTSAD